MKPRIQVSAGPGAPGNWDPAAEEAYALKAGEVFGPLFEQLKASLPPGTDCAIAIGAPPLQGSEEGRLLVFSTDRKRMASLLGQWIINSNALR